MLCSARRPRWACSRCGADTTVKLPDLHAYVIYRCVVGSRAYGLAGTDSDTDRRGIYLPPAEWHWSLEGVPEQLERYETQETYWDLRKFLTLALKLIGLRLNS